MIIDPSRKEFIESEANNKADYKIYSDGSGQDNGIGLAAILYKKEKTGQLKSLKAYLGTAAEHNTYKAKIIGAIIALWIIQNTPETIGKNVSLCTDNQSIIDAISNPKSTSGQYLVNSLRKSANATECNLYICWMLSHSKVKGNEVVDQLAKEAAAGRSSPRAKLPHILQTTLQTSALALKQDYTLTLKTKWAQIWRNLPRKARTEQLGLH